MNIPRPEHPRPQFVRDTWFNLNGSWTFTFDFGRSGMDAGRELFKSTGFDHEIIVPFCPESELSGVDYKDFIEMMWYHRMIDIPADWAGRRVLLHFGAVDYECEVFIDGVSAGCHFGGSSSFCFDVTRLVSAGTSHNLVVKVIDDMRSGVQPYGKQCFVFKSHGCSYTRTTGIWQTVWLEAVDPCGLAACRIVPDLDGGRFILTPEFHAVRRGLSFSATISAAGEPVAEASCPALDGVSLSLPLDSPRPWSPDNPFLYDLELTVRDGDDLVDTVRSYAGLRKIHIEDNQLFLNNEPLYQRLVLDQGFYPDGIWTAPSDAALKHDIELSLAAGFNGARLHQKVFEERFHYWADRLGYLTWGEFPSWGCNPNSPAAVRNAQTEWREILLRDRNHPSIITWTPWNETWQITDRKHHLRSHVEAYDLCKAIDPTRPVTDSSGGFHYKADIWTVHNYEADGQKLAETLAPGPDGSVWSNYGDRQSLQYQGQPYIVDEFGGIKWIPQSRRAFADNSWGYGNAPQTLDEFYARLEKQIDALLSLPHVTGFCYTQLTDVEQEENGIYNYNRSQKFDMTRIKAIFSKHL